MKRSNVISLLFRVPLLFAALASCDVNGSLGGLSTVGGSLSIVLGVDVADRNLSPELSLEVASFDISGSGPDGAAFTATDITGTSYSRTGLMPGSWTITATGKNAAGTPIVVDSETAAISVGLIAQVFMQCLPICGDGFFTCAISWPGDSVIAPAVVGGLTPAAGEGIALELAVSDTAAACSSTPVAAGYYTLYLNLYDQFDDTLVWSWMETVLIVAGQTTTGAWTLTTEAMELVQTGGILVNLSADARKPIEITLTGTSPVFQYGSAINVGAAGTPEPDSWQWYLDGAAIIDATGASLSLGSELSNGAHSLVVIGKKGEVAGSAGFRFRISENLISRDGLVAEWLFSDDFSDTSGNNDNLTAYSGSTPTTAQLIADRFGSAAKAPYLNTEIYLRGTNSVAASPVYSFSFWINAESYTHTNNARIITPAGDDSYCIVAHNIDGTGIGNNRWCQTSEKPALGEWAHFVVMMDSTNNVSKIYRDGVFSVSGTFSQAYPDSPYWLIGRHNGFDWDHWMGSIDDIRVYSRVLTNDFPSFNTI